MFWLRIFCSGVYSLCVRGLSLQFNIIFNTVFRLLSVSTGLMWCCCRYLPACFHSTYRTPTSCNATWTTCCSLLLTCQSHMDTFYASSLLNWQRLMLVEDMRKNHFYVLVTIKLTWPLTFRPQICSHSYSCRVLRFQEIRSFSSFPVSRQLEARDGQTDISGATLNVASHQADRVAWVIVYDNYVGRCLYPCNVAGCERIAYTVDKMLLIAVLKFNYCRHRFWLSANQCIFLSVWVVL